jgi:hypothetical protein
MWKKKSIDENDKITGYGCEENARTASNKLVLFWIIREEGFTKL